MKHTVTEHKTSNGTAGLMVDIPGTDVFGIVVRFNSGYQFADRSTYELPHVMEHLMAGSTERYPRANQFSVEASKNGAYFNAYTTSSVNGFVFECADFEIDRVLDLLEEQLVRPLFTPESLAAEIGNVREELTRNITDHGSVCYLQLGEQAYPDEVLNYQTRLDQLDKITLADIERFYRRAFTASNGRFYVGGPLGNRTERLVARLSRIFAQLPKGEELKIRPDVGRLVAKPVVTPRDIPQIYYRMAWYLDELDEAEIRAIVALRLALTGGFGSRIMGEVRRRGVAYGISATTAVDVGNTSFGFEGYVTPANAEALFEIIARHMSEAMAGKLTRREIDDAKRLGIGSTKRSNQTVGDVAGWYITPYERDRTINDIDQYLNLLDRVEPAEVTAVVNRVISYGRHGTSFVGDITPERANELTAILKPLWE